MLWHLHHLPEGSLLATGTITAPRSLVRLVGCRVHACYFCAGVCLFVSGFVGMLMCLCENARGREGETKKKGERKGVCCYAFLDVLPLVSSHETSQWGGDECTYWSDFFSFQGHQHSCNKSSESGTLRGQILLDAGRKNGLNLFIASCLAVDRH